MSPFAPITLLNQDNILIRLLRSNIELPIECEFTFGPEKIYMGFKLEFEDIILVDVILIARRTYNVAKKRQTC